MATKEQIAEELTSVTNELHSVARELEALEDTLTFASTALAALIRRSADPITITNDEFLKASEGTDVKAVATEGGFFLLAIAKGAEE